MEYLSIKNVKIKKTAALAPMAGVADHAFRAVAKEFGAAYVVGEMASCKGMVYSDRKTAELLTVTEAERPMAIQLFGCEPEFVAPAIRIAERFSPDVIDLNCGCPVPKVAGNGAGCALMKAPKLFGEMVSAAVRATALPITVKIRKGWDEESVNAVEIARIAEECGASAIAVHGRTRNQMYSGEADWEIIADVKRAVKIPVIGNGDVNSAEKCREMYEKTGCDLVMIGRAACGRPWIFREIEQSRKGEPFSEPSLTERLEIMRRHIRLLVEDKGERVGMREARMQVGHYLKGIANAAKYRAICGALTAEEDLDRLIALILSENGLG
ncbi:MAG: tRNA dihydrouridine synthase DusB [Bacteroides sp.]|nr:tRNA dihydrouridine synthase DusB [Eubacterium sp.]MCM1418293.1 tRNA dihydrouridine synthase DusB [Roseburia sp.]MCM1462396.1 tRNA dihydrouridine synthase DusB [Bacteroides sp.]